MFSRHQSVFSSPVGQFGLAAVAVISICKIEVNQNDFNYGTFSPRLDAAYKMLAGHSPDQKANFKDKEARITRPDLRGQSDVHDKLAVEQNPKKPREGKN